MDAKGTVFEKSDSSEWLEMPWERYEESSSPVDAAARFLQALEIPMNANGMQRTPERMVGAMAEMTEGYDIDPKSLLRVRFPVSYDEMIAVRDIEFWSLCEHHVLPFHGTSITFMSDKYFERSFLELNQVIIL